MTFLIYAIFSIPVLQLNFSFTL